MSAEATKPAPRTRATKKPATDAAAPSAENLTRIGPPEDGISDADRAALAADEARERAAESARARSGMYEDDQALIEVPTPGMHVDNAVTDSYGTNGGDDMETELKNARRAAMGVREFTTSDPLYEGQRPIAPLSADGGYAPAMETLEFVPGAKVRHDDTAELVREMDELDQLLGSNRWQANAVFPFFRDRKYGHKFAFRRHYYTLGVLVDTFADAGPKVIQELSDRAASVERYNATCSSDGQKMGYLAYVVGAVVTPEDAKQAKARRVVTLLRRELVPDTAVVADPGRIFEQHAPIGAARIGQKPIALPGGATLEAAYFHDAMKGIFTLVASDGTRVQAPNMQQAETQLCDAVIAKAAEAVPA